MSETKTLTYDEIITNWRYVETAVVQQQFSNSEDEVTFRDVLTRIVGWLLDASLLRETMQKDIAQFIISRHDSLKADLLAKRIVPSSQILKYGGTSHERKNYFSSTALGDVQNYDTDFLNRAYECGTVCGLSLPQAAVGFDTENSYERLGLMPLPKKRKGSLAVTLSEDSVDIEDFIHSSHHLGISPYVKMEHKSNSNVTGPIAMEVHKGNNLGLIFGDNLKTNSPLPPQLDPFFVSAYPGYIGVENSSCPTFYVNLPEILKTSKNYNDYLKRLHKISFNAAILANIILCQTEGYLSEEIRENTLKYRPIMIGMLGLHGAMIRCDVNYESEEALQFAEETQASITLGTMAASSRLMCLATKRDRVACRASWLVEIANECSLILNDYFSTKSIINHIASAMEQHGCLYNGMTTGQVPDPYVNSVVHSMSYGISPLSSIEMTVEVEDRSLTLFPLEIFDNTGTMTCDLDVLNQHTSGYISPEYQLDIVRQIQKFCHAGVFKPILCPENITVNEITQLFDRAEELGLRTVLIYRQDTTLLERDEIIIEEPDEEKVEPDIATVFQELEEVILEPEEVEQVEREPQTSIGDNMAEAVTNAKIYTLHSDQGVYKLVIGNENGIATDIIVDIPNVSATTENLVVALSRLVTFLLQDRNSHIQDAVIEILSSVKRTETPYRQGKEEYNSLPEALGKILLQYTQKEENG